jgi:DNA-binding IclR family transcriptional regulator
MTTRTAVIADASQTLAREGTGTVFRVVRLLAAIAEAGRPVGVGKLADELGLATSTVHRLLQLLRKEGIVDWDTETHLYFVGAEYYRIAARVVGAVHIRDLARPFIQRIAEQFDETTLLGLHLPAQRAMMFVARADGSQALQYRIALDQPLALVWGASGKSVLAFLPKIAVTEAIASAKPGPASGAPVPPREVLLSELAEIRDRGYAVTEAEKLPGARGIAVPVFGRRGVIGSICLTSPKERLPHASIGEIALFIVEQAAVLSQTLGAARTS